MQGWFAHTHYFLPNENILPIWLGTHFTQNIFNFFNKNNISLKSCEFGARDLYTFFNAKNMGANVYFSRCLSLTLPKRKPNESQNRIFIVNLNDDILHLLPKNIRENAYIINQKNLEWDNNLADNWEQYLTMTQQLLDRYKSEAKLIITTALHCASPAIAMGIPVILLQENIEQSARFSALHGILPIYSLDDLKDIDFDKIVAPDIEDLKLAMIENLKLSILKALGKDVDIQKLYFLRDFIGSFNINNINT